MSLPWTDTRTDVDGRYSTDRRSEVVRFSKDGYEPVTTTVSGATSTIVLRPTHERPWAPPVCSQANARRFGNVMQFIVPRPTNVKEIVDVDYRLTEIRYRGTSLTFGTGPLLSWGLPSKDVLRSIIHERDVRIPWDGEAAEYRGRNFDGTFWRGILMFGESIAYAQADEKAAKYFDGIIDTLCFQKGQTQGR